MIKKNFLATMLALLRDFEEWKRKNNIGNVFEELEKRYKTLINNQNKILSEIKKINSGKAHLKSE